MKQLLLLIIPLCFSLVGKGQCIPDISLINSVPGLYPDSITDFQIGAAAYPYSQDFNIVVGTHAEQWYPYLLPLGSFPLNSVVLTGVNGLPTGFNYACNTPNCTWNPGDIGCFEVYGSHPISDTFDISFTLAHSIYVFSSLTWDSINLDNYKLILLPCPSTGLSSNVYATSCDQYLGYPFEDTLYFSGVYQDTLNCDSIYTLNLTILNSSSSTITQSSCGSYTLNNQTYTSSGTYTQTLTNVAGCDSTITLNLTVNPNQFSPDFSVNQTLFTAPPFAAQFTNTTPNASNYNFTWDFSDGTILQSNNPSVFHEYLYNGLYDVTLIAEDINTGCTDTIFYDDYIYCTGGTSCTHASTINQLGPITACVSDSVFLSCNTGSNFTYQWRLNGTYIPGAVDTIYYPTQTGNYSVLIMDNGCPEVSPDVSVVISSSPQTPIITSSGNITPCLGGSVTLSVPATYSSYNWSSGGTSSSEVVTSSGNYFVTVSNSTGCEVSSPIYTINASFATPPDVCIVGVDSITNYNKVVWEKPISTAIDSFYVYKESNQANIYQKIGGTSYSDTALFNDLSSNPAAQAYRYKLSLVDSCGIESSLGSMHKSIHLTINQGVGTTWNLIWSHYEGFTFPSYNIYRGTTSTNMTLLTTIASNLNSYTDLTAPAGQLFYQIEVVSNYTCDPLKSNYNVSRSNVVDNAEAPSIIVQQENSNVNVYPNPTSDQITIDIKGYNGNVNIEVYDLQGRLLETTTNTIVSLKKHAKGIYVLKISYGEVTEEVRVVRD